MDDGAQGVGGRFPLTPGPSPGGRWGREGGILWQNVIKVLDAVSLLVADFLTEFDVTSAARVS